MDLKTRHVYNEHCSLNRLPGATGEKRRDVTSTHSPRACAHVNGQRRLSPHQALYSAARRGAAVTGRHSIMESKTVTSWTGY